MPRYIKIIPKIFLFVNRYIDEIMRHLFHFSGMFISPPPLHFQKYLNIEEI